MRAIITGAAGFIGKNLTKTLLEQGSTVLGIDNFSTGDSSSFSRFSKRYKEKFRGCVFDIANTEQWRPLMTEAINFFGELDDVTFFHLACPASPPAYQKYPLRTLNTSYLGTRNCLEFASTINCDFLFTSTSEVYGDPTINPQNESYLGNVNTVGPRSCYDEGKRVAETLCYEYNRALNINVTVVRIFNTYGPGMMSDDGRVVSNFVNQCLNDRDITIYGDGSQTRSFCYVDDMVEGLLLAAASGEFGPINLGNPNEITVSELSSIVKEKTRSYSKIINMPLPKDDPCLRRPDITLASNLLNWRPTTNLSDGLDKTIEYFSSIEL